MNENYVIDISRFDKIRPLGVSGYMCVRNEEAYMELVVEQCIGELDELIICYGVCDDKTPEIAEKCREKYPTKIKVFPYPFPIHPVASNLFTLEKDNKSFHTMANQRNFALSKITYKYAVIIDGDDYFIPSQLKKICDLVKMDCFWDNYMCFGGINLIEKNGRMFTTTDMHNGWHFCGLTDRGVYRLSANTHYTKNNVYECFNFHNYSNVGINYAVYFHLKHLKPGKGVAGYSCNPSDIAHGALGFMNRIANQSYIEWFEYRRKYPYWARFMPDPNTLKLPIRTWEQKHTNEYNHAMNMLDPKKYVEICGKYLGRNICTT